MDYDYQIAYMKLKDAVKKMLAAQQQYFGSGKDPQKLRIAKALEKEVKDMVDPPAAKERTLFDLAQ